MSPADAKRLTPQEAMFYLAGEDTVKAMEYRSRKRQALRDGRTADDLRNEAREYMRALREKHTGSSDRDAG